MRLEALRRTETAAGGRPSAVRSRPERGRPTPWPTSGARRADLLAGAPGHLLGLQRLAGNQAVAELVAGMAVQRDGEGDAAPAAPAAGRTAQVVVPLTVPIGVAATPAGDQAVGAGGGAGGEERPRLGIDVSATGGVNLAAADTFNPASPLSPGPLRLRGGGQAAAGDWSGSIGPIFVWRDFNARTLRDGWHLGHELQGGPTVGVQSGPLGPVLVIGASGGIDVFHHQFQTALGDLDFHALTAQLYANLGVPLSGPPGGGPAPAPALGYGAAVSSGVELHPGHQKRMSVSAVLVLAGGGATDTSSGQTVPAVTTTFNLVVTGNLLNP